MAEQEWWKAQGTEVPKDDWWSSAGTPVQPDAPTQATPATPAIPKPSSALRRVAGDTAVTAGKAAMGLGETLVGLANIPTFGYAGKALDAVGYDPKAVHETLNDLYTPEAQASLKAIDDAKGFGGTIKAAVQNPVGAGHKVLESVPAMLAGGGIARKGLSLLPAGASAAKKALALGAGEGIIAAGSAAEGIRQQTDDGLLTGKQVGAALATGAGTGLIGAAGGRLAQTAFARKLGIVDPDAVVAGVGKAAGEAAPGIGRRVLSSAFTEGVLEELPQSAQEQALQNIALDRPVMEGVPEAAGLGTVLGGVMGGGFGAIARPGAAKPEATPEQGKAQPEAQPDFNVALDGTATANPSADPLNPRNVANRPAPQAQAAPETQSASTVVTPDPFDGQAINAELDAKPTLLDGAPVPDAAGGALSKSVNVGVETGAVPTLYPQAQPGTLADVANKVSPFGYTAPTFGYEAPTFPPAPNDGRTRLAQQAQAQGIDPRIVLSLDDSETGSLDEFDDTFLAGYAKTLWNDVQSGRRAVPGLSPQELSRGQGQDPARPVQERPDVDSVGLRGDDVPVPGAVANAAGGRAGEADGQPAKAGERAAAVPGDVVGAQAEGVSRTNPFPKEREGDAPVGSWVAGPDVPGMSADQVVRQIQDVPLDRIDATEFDSAGNIAPEKRADAERYAEAMKRGEQFPNGRASELPNGKFKLQDGHRRYAAAKASGATSMRLAVSPLPADATPAPTPAAATARPAATAALSTPVDTAPSKQSGQAGVKGEAGGSGSDYFAGANETFVRDVPQYGPAGGDSGAMAAVKAAPAGTVIVDVSRRPDGTEFARVLVSAGDGEFDAAVIRDRKKPLSDYIAEAKKEAASHAIGRRWSKADRDGLPEDLAAIKVAVAEAGGANVALGASKSNSEIASEVAQKLGIPSDRDLESHVYDARQRIVREAEAKADGEARERFKVGAVIGAFEMVVDSKRRKFSSATVIGNDGGWIKLRATMVGGKKDGFEMSVRPSAFARQVDAAPKKPRSQMTSKEVKEAEKAKADSAEAYRSVWDDMTEDERSSLVLYAWRTAGGNIPASKRLIAETPWDRLSPATRAALKPQFTTYFNVWTPVNKTGERADRARKYQVRLEATPKTEEAPKTGKSRLVDGVNSYHYVDGQVGMTSGGSFTKDASRWITFSREDVERMGDSIKPYGATRMGVFTPANKAQASKEAPKAGKEASGEVMAANTEDAGEELWANRRNSTGKGLQWADIQGINPTLKAREVVKTKVWPRPNYEQLIEGGIPAPVARIIKSVYDAIATKPQTVKTATDEDYQAYIAGVQKLRDAAFAWARDVIEQAPSAELPEVVEFGEKHGLSSKDVAALVGVLRKKGGDGSMLDAVFPFDEHLDRSRFRGNTARSKANNDLALLLGGRKLAGTMQVIPQDIMAAIRDVQKGWPSPQEAWEKSYTIHEDKVGERKYRNGQTVTITEPSFWIATKQGRFNLIVAEGFKTREEAAAAAKELHEKKRKKGGDGSKAEAPVNLQDTREGPQRRQSNEDITSDTLRDTFGFKGVNFGNWMKGDTKAKRAERQAHLNNAYDSMLDLAEILGVPPRAMSLNGMLGLAIGAQGHGGRAAAHFVPGVNEINLTREQGAGSLAHEWAHALDHYFATLAGSKIATSKTPFLTEHTADKLDGVRPEVQEAFKAIVKAMRGRDATADELAAQERASLEAAKRSLDRGLAAMRDNLANRTLKTGSGRAREDVLSSFDELADRLRNGDIGEGYLKIGKGFNDSEPQVVAMLAMLYRESLGNKYPEIGAIGYNARRVADGKKAKQSNAAHIPQVPSNFRREAVKLDRGTAGKYWSSTLEMFARSFQSYVLDRLAAQGARNDYLTRPQMDEATLKVAQEMGIGEDGDRYPRGDERNTINRGFDTLIASLRTRETDTGIALESVEATELTEADLTPAQRASRDRQSIDRKALRETLSREQGEADADALGLREAVQKALGDAGTSVVYLRNVDGLPDDVRGPQERAAAQRGKGMRTAGLYHPASGTVYLFTDVAKTPEMAAFTASHEIAGHKGLRAMLGDKLNKALDMAEQNSTVKAIAASMTRQRNLRPDQRYLAIEEALADLAGANATGNWQRIKDKHGVAVPKEMRSRVAAAIANFIARVKALFGKQGVAFSDAQVRDLLVAARQAAGATVSVMQADGSMALEQAVYHGTPHTVDRFSLQKIGTGEGAQAYGWGMYFASMREVAEQYRLSLAGKSLMRRGVLGIGKAASAKDAREEIAWSGKDLRRAGAEILRHMEAGHSLPESTAMAKKEWSNNSFYTDANFDAAAAEIGKSKFYSVGKKGNLYRVEVPEDSDLLDWDKPLSEQPEKVQGILRPALEARGGKWEKDTGKRIYLTLAADGFGDTSERYAAASEYLNSIGIPGLRYLDGSSRSDGKGSHNYVIWDESAIGTPEALESVDTGGVDLSQTKVVDKDGKPLTVYHGTFGQFDDFDPDMLGSATGAPSAFGGFFFASNRGVAQSYASAAAKTTRTAPGQIKAVRAEIQEVTGVSPERASFNYARGNYDAHPEIERIEGLFDRLADLQDAMQSATDDYFADGSLAEDGRIVEAKLDIRNPLIHEQDGPVRTEAFSALIERAKAAGHDGVIIRNTEDDGAAGGDHDPATDVFIAFTPQQIIQSGTPEALESAEFDESQYRPQVAQWAKSKFGDRIAPNGKPAWQNFTEWFGDSQVVNDKGEPLVVYRGGTPSEIIATDGQNPAQLGPGAYFGGIGTAQDFAEWRENGEVGAYFLALNTPFDETRSYIAPESMMQALRARLLEIGVPKAYVSELSRPYRGAITNLAAQLAKKRGAGGSPWAAAAEINAALRGAGFDGIIADWPYGGEQYVAFRPEQIKSADSNAGNFSPNEGSILESVEDFALDDNPPTEKMRIPGEIRLDPAYKSGFKGVLQRLGQKLADVKPHILGAVPLNHLVDFAPKGVPAIGQYIDLQYQMQAFRNSLYTRYDKIAQDMLAYAANGKGIRGYFGKTASQQARDLFDLMHDSTIAGIDPTKDGYPDEKVVQFEALKRRYEALPEEGQRLYREVRDAYKAQAQLLDETIANNFRRAMEIALTRAERKLKARLQEIDESSMSVDEKIKARGNAQNAYDDQVTMSEKDTMARLMALRKMLESNRVQEPYFPLKRYGKHWVTVLKDGVMVGFSKFETTAEQEAFSKQMQAEGYSTRLKFEDGESNVREMIDPEFAARVEEILQGAKVPDEVKDDVWQAYLERMPDMSLRKSFIHRQNVPGYHFDALKAFGSSAFHGSYQIARLKYGLEMTETIDLAKEQANTLRTTKPQDAIDADKITGEVEKRHAFVMNPTGGKAAQAVTTAAFLYSLGANPAHLFLNATQTIMLGVPVLGSRYGFGRTASALQKAVADFTKGKGHTENANLSDDERKAFNAFMASGLIDKTQAHDLAGVGETGVDYSAVRQKVMNKIGWFFHQSERLNREVTAMAAYRLARKDGKSHDAAVSQAIKDAYTIHFDYSAAARPRYMQNDTAKALFVFRNFQVNMLYRLFRDISQSIKGESVQVRREARKQLGAMFGMYGLFAGTMGMPFYGLAMALAGGFEDEDDPVTAEQQFVNGTVEFLGPTAAKVLLRGLPGTAFDIDLTERIGMPNLWFRSPNQELEGRDAYYYWMEQLLGAGVAPVKGAIDGFNLVMEGQIQRGLERAMPAALRNPMQSIRMAQEGGVTSLDGDLIKATNAGDMLTKALGFQPLSVSEQYDANSAIKGADRRLSNRRERLLNRYFLALQMGDDTGEPLAEIQAFNAKNPEYAITRKTIERSRNLRNRNKLQSENGIVMTRRMRSLRDRMEDED